ncbi:MAG: hypothetical protein O3B95_01025 [Chloroflexi bacterium]|nr:hypothetical protein [Chloroflexota bacterium]
MNVTIKVTVVSAIAIGLAVGVIAAITTGGPAEGRGRTSIEGSTSSSIDPKYLPIDVLKALPADELAELFPEKAEAILNPEAINEIKSSGGNSNDPKYLRAVLEKMGVNPPENATTKELQDMLARASSSSDSEVAGK